MVWVRDSTGVITARFLAEKDNPRADMVLGLAATACCCSRRWGCWRPTSRRASTALKAAFRDTKEPYTWTGMDAYLGVICFNTAEAGKAGVERAEVLEGPARPEIQGQAGDAASGVLRHRLPDGRRLAADDGRGRRLEVHGRPAREHGRLYPFRLGALRAGRQGRARRRHRARHARRIGEDEGRAARGHHPGRRHRLGHGSVRHRQGHEEPRAAKKVADWAATKAANELYSKTYAIVAHART